MTQDGTYKLRLLLRLAPDIPEPEYEHRFCDGRRWRFDAAWPGQKCAVEVNGGRWMPGGGRHGGDADMTKLRRAAALGWRVLPVSPYALETAPWDFLNDLREALGLEVVPF